MIDNVKTPKLTVTFQGTVVRVEVDGQVIGVLQNFRFQANSEEVYPSGVATLLGYHQGKVTDAAVRSIELLKAFHWLDINVLPIPDEKLPEEALFESLREEGRANAEKTHKMFREMAQETEE